MRPAVQGDHSLAVELELDRHDASLGPGPRLSIAGNVQDLRLREDGSVELRRLLGLGVEPKERGDLLHGSCSILHRATRTLNPPQAANFLFGTGTTNPSTYRMCRLLRVV